MTATDGTGPVGRPDDGTGRPRPDTDRAWSVLSPALIAIMLAIIAFLLGLWASGREDEPAEVTAFDACQDLSDNDTAIQDDLVALCGTSAIPDEVKRHIVVTECPGHQVAQLQYHSAVTGELEPLFLGSMMVRFGADEFTGGDSGFVPGIGSVTPVEGAQIWVVDYGAHGQFVASIAASMIGADDYRTIRVDDLAKEAGASPITDPVVLLDLGDPLEPGEDRFGDADLFIATESHVVAALDELHRADGVAKQQMVLNLSFGTYRCEHPPERLEAALHRLSEHGVRVVAAAGNSEQPTLPYPAAFAANHDLADTVTSVGAVEEPGGMRACFSNFGHGVEWWRPGQEVEAERGEERGTWSGTSFAAPQAAASLAALGVDDEIIPDPAPAPPAATYDIAMVIDDRSSGFDDEPITAMTWCDPGGPYQVKGVEVRYE